jgi:ribosomal protein L40E
MPKYVCRKCGAAVPVETTADKTDACFSKGETKTVVVKCPKCGESNTFQVPKQ